jgi:hypothetical protein
MTSIDSDYQLSQMHYERQVELIDAIKYHQLQETFLRTGAQRRAHRDSGRTDDERNSKKLSRRTRPR